MMKYLIILNSNIPNISAHAKMLEWVSIISFTIAMLFLSTAMAHHRYARKTGDMTFAKSSRLRFMAGICLVVIGVCLLLLR